MKYFHMSLAMFIPLENCLFCAVTLTKSADIDKYRYSGYETGFDRRGIFSFPGGGFGKNVKMFGADMNSSIHVDNKEKDILILGTDPTQGFGVHSLTAETCILLILARVQKKFV